MADRNRIQDTDLKSPSDEEFLQGIVGISLKAFESMYLNKKEESRAELTQSIAVLQNSIQSIDYTQSEISIYDEEAREDVNLFDQQIETAKNSLENFREVYQRPIFKVYLQQSELMEQHAVQQIAYQESMRDVREESLDSLETLATQYINLVKKDPSFTDKGSWSQGQEIIDDIQKGYQQYEYTFGKKIPAQQGAQIANLLKQYEIDERNIMADADRHKPGFQTRLADRASPYLEEFFKAEGMIALPETYTKKDEEYRTFMFPKGEEEGTIELPDTDMYKHALTYFDKYQAIQTAAESENIILQQAAAEAHPFAVMRDWMEAPGDAYQLEAANAIAYQLFSDTDQTIEQNLADMEAPGVDVGPYKDLIKAKYHELKDLWDTGRHSLEFKNMQTTYNKLKKAKIKATGLTIDQMSGENAAAIRSRIGELNTNLAVFNAQDRIEKKPSKQLLTLPNFADKGQTTKDAKQYIVERLDLLLAEANDWEMDRNEPGADIKLIRDFENAEGQNKLVKIQNLVNKYLDPKGFELYPEDINAAFDVGDWGEEERDIINKNTFYALLKAFQAVSNADPEGTTEFSFLQSLLQQ